jgi:hypothetical protein
MCSFSYKIVYVFKSEWKVKQKLCWRNTANTWAEKILYAFKGSKNAEYPEAGIVFDKAGNIYGTTSHGGKDHVVYDGAGTVYELVAPKYTEKVLWSFDVTDGYQAVGGLTLDGGNFYGTTWVGGSSGSCPDGCGVVFEVTP